MSGRRFVAVIGLIATTALSAGAFRIDYHEKITKQALTPDALFAQNQPNRLPPEWKDAIGPGFSASAMTEIINANKSMDLGACPPSAGDNPCDSTTSTCIQGMLPPTDFTIPAHPCVWHESENFQGMGNVNNTLHPDHFDAEQIQAGSDQLYRDHQQFIKYLKARNYVGARKLLGKSLHGIQDFYAHSNWVELQYLTIDTRLASPPEQQLFTALPPRVPNAHEPACELVNDLLNPAKFQHLLPNYSHDMAIQDHKPLPLDLLTSGYYSFFNKDEPVTKYSKCSHGSPGTEAGINKDTPETLWLPTPVKVPGYDQAEVYATVHSTFYLLETIKSDNDLKADPTYTLGLMGHPILLSVGAAGALAGDWSLRVNGAGFKSLNDPAVYVGNNLQSTTFYSDKLLHGLVAPADIPVNGSVPVTVKQKDVDVNGNPTMLSSNQVPFEDCPGKVRPHKHIVGYTDVNAIEWNDTGQTVKAGDKLKFDVVLDSSAYVVWRAGIFLLTDTLGARPTGDRTANPGTILGWVPPQMDISVAPIGALIGMVLDPNATGPLLEKPKGAHYFPILDGRSVPAMPASGELYLGINDGAFSNNGGCFQVRITPPIK